MSDSQKAKVGKKPSSPLRITLMGAGATALAVLNIMMNGAEAPSQAVSILQYGALAAALLALVGGAIMLAMAPKRDGAQ